MSFRPNTREFWLEVADYKCQYEQYTEKKGFQDCNAPAKHVHHIKGEHETLVIGENPDENTGLPLCTPHHVRNIGLDLGEPDSSFHPDMGQAYLGYKEWKANAQHMNYITGKRLIDYSDSPFAEAAKEHKVKIEHGERYINGDEGTDIYYTDKMTEKATRWLAEHPEEKKPHMKPHPEYDPSKKPKRWYDFDE